jgi:hypothetical protein
MAVSIEGTGPYFHHSAGLLPAAAVGAHPALFPEMWSIG